MGIAARTDSTVPIPFPAVVWKRLLGESVSIDDLKDVDIEVVERFHFLMRTDLSEEEFQLYTQTVSLTFTAHLCDGTEVELIENGSCVPVTFATRHQFAHALIEARLQEGSEQIAAIRAGLHEILPSPLFATYTAAEIEQLIAGMQTCRCV